MRFPMTSRQCPWVLGLPFHTSEDNGTTHWFLGGIPCLAILEAETCEVSEEILPCLDFDLFCSFVTSTVPRIQLMRLPCCSTIS